MFCGGRGGTVAGTVSAVIGIPPYSINSLPLKLCAMVNERLGTETFYIMIFCSLA